MSEYLQSKNITVFPSSRRSDKQPSARYQQESTFTNIIQNISDVDGSFIVTKPDTYELTYNDPQSKVFEFYLYGYLFRIKYLNSLYSKFENSKNIYAYINIDSFDVESVLRVTSSGDTEVKESIVESHEELKGRDVLSDFYLYTGVIFTNDVESIPQDAKSLYLFERGDTADAWHAVKQSFFKFDSRSLNFSVDGGEIVEQN